MHLYKRMGKADLHGSLPMPISYFGMETDLHLGQATISIQMSQSLWPPHCDHLSLLLCHLLWIPSPSQMIQCYCDNSGVITNLMSMKDCAIIWLNDTTNDDHDLYVAITAEAAKCHPLHIHYIHVKDHQDQNNDKPLTTEEAYNVNCDNTAKNYVQQCNLQSTMLEPPEFEAAQPHLLIASKIICWWVIPTLWKAAAAPEHWDYMWKCYNWSQANINGIQWAALASALNSFQLNGQQQLILFIHDKLPLRTSNFHPHMGSQLCASCRRNPEDKWHFLQCPHPEWQQQFEKLRANLTSLSIKHTLHPGILTTYWLGLVSVCTTTPYPTDLHKLPSALKTAIHYQEHLGWIQLIYGHMTRYWASAIKQLNPHIAPSGMQIMAKFLQTVWSYILATWSIRKWHLHNDAGDLSIPNYQQVVWTLYERKDQLTPDEQDALFWQPLQEMLELPPAIPSPWIVRAHKYMTQQSKAAQTRARLNTLDTCSFFPTQSANDLQPP